MLQFQVQVQDSIQRLGFPFHKVSLTIGGHDETIVGAPLVGALHYCHPL